jgi:hypothetical protein
VSDRADIVTEIKSHVLSAMERDPNQSIDSVLASLGEPEMVANRYLLERGLKPGKPPISPVVKWIVIGFLGTMALFLAGLVVLAIYLSPVVKVDEEKQQVKLFGGLVQVDGEDVTIGSQKLREMSRSNFSGSAVAVKQIRIELSNGKLDVRTARDNKFSWNCRGSGISAFPLSKKGEMQVLKVSSLAFVDCEIEVPVATDLSIEGANGQIDLDEPQFSAKVDLGNGKVDIDPRKGTRYAYDLKVTNGKVDQMPSDPNPEFRIQVKIDNGKISN